MVPLGSIMMMRRTLRLLLALVVATLDVAAADFVASPRLLWTMDTDGSTTGRGNAVTLSQDNSRLLLTTEQGDLHFVMTSDPLNAEQKRLRFIPDYEATESISCASGATLFPTRQPQAEQGNNDNNPQQYAVYAILELDQGSSNVIAVDIRSAQMVWNVRVQGLVAGSPVANEHGNRIYVTHNTQSAGFVSVLQVSHDFQSARLLETLQSSDSVNAMAPLTPPTLRSVAIQASDDDDDNNDDDSSSVATLQDILVFAEMDAESPDTGSLYVLLSHHTGDSTSRTTTGTLNLLLASEYPRSAMARPALSNNGLHAYLGQASARLTGWDSGDNDLAGVVLNGGNADNVFPAWEQRLSEDGLDAKNDPMQKGTCCAVASDSIAHHLIFSLTKPVFRFSSHSYASCAVIGRELVVCDHGRNQASNLRS